MSESEPPKTGKCYCGCGGDTSGHWVPGHDRHAEGALLQLVYGKQWITDIVAMLGYGPSNSIVEAAKAAQQAKLAQPLAHHRSTR